MHYENRPAVAAHIKEIEAYLTVTSRPYMTGEKLRKKPKPPGHPPADMPAAINTCLDVLTLRYVEAVNSFNINVLHPRHFHRKHLQPLLALYKVVLAVVERRSLIADAADGIIDDIRILAHRIKQGDPLQQILEGFTAHAATDGVTEADLIHCLLSRSLDLTNEGNEEDAKTVTTAIMALVDEFSLTRDPIQKKADM